MQSADTVPFRGVTAKVILRRGDARGADRRQPLAVARNNRIVGIKARDQGPGDVGSAAGLTQPKKRPRPLAVSFDQPGFGESRKCRESRGCD